MKYSIVDKVSGEVIYNGLCIGGSFGDSPVLLSTRVQDLPEYLLEEIEESMGDNKYELAIVEEDN